MRSIRGLIRRARIVCVALACVVLAACVSQAVAATSHKKTVHRVGGHVHHAWPLRGKAPKGPLARWLAKQVGPTRVKPCRIRRHGRIAACRRKKIRGKSALPPGFRGQIVRLHPDATTTTTATTLQLIRSFDIPTSDPSYVRLLNWSWTYDSAIAAAAFGVVGDTSEAQQLLDQLSALQHTNGSIEEAFNVSTNEAESLLRSGDDRDGRLGRRPRCFPASADMHF